LSLIPLLQTIGRWQKTLIHRNLFSDCSVRELSRLLLSRSLEPAGTPAVQQRNLLFNLLRGPSMVLGLAYICGRKSRRDASATGAGATLRSGSLSFQRDRGLET
jgi:hypothetical protein